MTNIVSKTTPSYRRIYINAAVGIVGHFPHTDIAAAWDGLGEASYIRQIPPEAIAFIPFLLWRRLGLVDAILKFLQPPI